MKISKYKYILGDCGHWRLKFLTEKIIQNVTYRFIDLSSFKGVMPQTKEHLALANAIGNLLVILEKRFINNFINFN